MIYGALPEDFGPLEMPTTEMLFWLYCPVSIPGRSFILPDNLIQFGDMLDAIWDHEPDLCRESYIYLTAKTLFISEGATPNRPGWHSDGFGTDDVNWIWYDRAPTQFLSDSFSLPNDCADSMEIMERRAAGQDLHVYPNRHLLRLTPAVIHRVNPVCPPGMRTFLKVSISKDRYNLEGNSVNHHLPYIWPTAPRRDERNHPTQPTTNKETQ